MSKLQKTTSITFVVISTLYIFNYVGIPIYLLTQLKQLWIFAILYKELILQAFTITDKLNH